MHPSFVPVSSEQRYAGRYFLMRRCLWQDRGIIANDIWRGAALSFTKLLNQAATASGGAEPRRAAPVRHLARGSCLRSFRRGSRGTSARRRRSRARCRESRSRARRSRHRAARWGHRPVPCPAVGVKPGRHERRAGGRALRAAPQCGCAPGNRRSASVIIRRRARGHGLTALLPSAASSARASRGR